ncbi:MAG: hypothetical protein Q8S18_14365 [Bacteroidales bacterium]|nr:hypothetical protein [Bacteroidales bacterium]
MPATTISSLATGLTNHPQHIGCAIILQPVPAALTDGIDYLSEIFSAWEAQRK